MDELTELAVKYRTDKCPQIGHSYSPFYYEKFKDIRYSVKKVLEIGVGYVDALDNSIHRAGASLFMWRDFFPNAQIYGADIMPECVFKEDRIETFLCDQTKKEDLLKLIEKTGTDIDIVIDDGSHEQRDQRDTCLTLMPLLKKDVIYIIEDVGIARNILAGVGDDYDWEDHPFKTHKHKDDRLLVIKHKKPNIILGKHSYGDIRITGGTKGLVKVGKYCSIGEDVVCFMSHDHNYFNISTYPFGHPNKEITRLMKTPLSKNDYNIRRKLEINIGNDVFIGSHSVIFRDVTIGDGAVIGAYSVITKDIPPYSVVVGNSRILRKRYSDKDIDFLLKLKWWDIEDHLVADMAYILCSPNINLLKEYVKEKGW